MFQIRAAVFGGLAFFATAAHAQSQPTATACGLSFWENVTTVQHLALEVPVEKVKSSNAKVISKIIKEEGLAAAYMTVHLVYMDCIKKTGIDVKRPGDAENDPYWRCAIQSANRTGILVSIEKGSTAAQLKTSMPPDFHDIIDLLSDEAGMSFLKAAAFSAQGGKDCVAGARAKTR